METKTIMHVSLAVDSAITEEQRRNILDSLVDLFEDEGLVLTEGAATIEEQTRLTLVEQDDDDDDDDDDWGDD